MASLEYRVRLYMRETSKQTNNMKVLLAISSGSDFSPTYVPKNDVSGTDDSFPLQASQNAWNARGCELVFPGKAYLYKTGFS